ncbi:MAG TPA: AAA domain-containing protein [Chitinophagales bacterium]|nr:AAA domain-containing protein [Chitinophagales bacterium]
MPSTSFIEKLLVRLKSGDARSIHLNALPGNFARLDIYDLINIEPSLHLKFLENLLTKKEFKFSVTIEPALLNSKTADEKKIVQKIIKRLNHLDYQEKEEFAEHGYHSFGFGYPLLIKRDPNNSDRILKAPLLIWYLTIEKDSRKNNTWTISRDEEHPLIFNELLQAHFESNEKIKTDDLDILLEDDFVDEKELNEFCKKILDKLNIPFDAATNIATILPCTNKETIETITKESAWIRWSGVFGLYKMQKQSIIKDVENLLKSEDESAIENESGNTYFDGEVLSPVALDPSQENVLQQLKQHNTLIIQGPPGTGKSQSLTAIITQALLNKKKVLVVCEKRTAMEVLYNNLKKQNLQHLCVLVDDVYSDRKNIVEHVRTIIEQTEQTPTRFRANEYELTRSKFLSLQEEINHRINFTNSEIFGDDNWMELLSRSYLLNQDETILENANSINKTVRNSDYAFTYEEFISLAEKIKTINELFLKLDKEAFIFDEIHDSYLSTKQSAVDISTDIQQIENKSSTVFSNIEQHLKLYGNDYDEQTGFTSFKVSFFSIFSSKYKNIIQLKEETKKQLSDLVAYLLKENIISSDLSVHEMNEKISNVLPKIEVVNTEISKFGNQLKNLPDYFNYKKYLLQQDTKTQAIISALVKTGNDNWQLIFETYYLNQTILKTALENGIKDDVQKLYDELLQTDKQFKQKLSEKINALWNDAIQNSIKSKDLTEIKYLYNQRKNKQFASKNSLRKIIHQDFDFFTTLFPVLMVNPTVCTSILPLQENLFDFIILDEASQLRLEDTYTSLLRGKTKIISGDKHQMPPSNFFGNDVLFWNENEEETTAEDFLAESKSLLEYADDANYKSSYLDYHYRSLHPDLIQFSNHAFYQSRLIPLPEKQPYQAVHYKNVEGIYADGTNQKEAEEIVNFIFTMEKTNDEYPGIGIATFNIFQRNLIFDKLYEHAYADKEKNEKLQALLNKGLFVKNLENIQGDERDVMILSTTFGKDEAGKFRQFFGPLTQDKGYQLLNVIITRAKHSLYVFTSIPENVFLQFEEELLQKGNKGKSIFYAYLSYVKSCSENNTTQNDFIKNTLQKNTQQLSAGKKIQEDQYKNQLYIELKKKLGDNVVQNYTLGGFNLDILIVKDNKPYLSVDFENTANYDSEISYRIKLHRQHMLDIYGIKTYHLWSYNWWKDAAKEMENITFQISSC